MSIEAPLQNCKIFGSVRKTSGMFSFPSRPLLHHCCRSRHLNGMGRQNLEVLKNEIHPRLSKTGGQAGSQRPFRAAFPSCDCRAGDVPKSGVPGASSGNHQSSSGHRRILVMSSKIFFPVIHRHGVFPARETAPHLEGREGRASRASGLPRLVRSGGQPSRALVVEAVEAGLAVACYSSGIPPVSLVHSAPCLGPMAPTSSGGKIA